MPIVYYYSTIEWLVINSVYYSTIEWLDVSIVYIIVR